MFCRMRRFFNSQRRGLGCFLHSLASLIDIAGMIPRRRRVAVPQSVGDALRSDWLAVGDCLRASLALARSERQKVL